MPKILVVDDERPIAEIIKYNLQKRVLKFRQPMTEMKL